MIYVFLIGFLAIGLFCVVKGVILRSKLDRKSPDYEQERSKANRMIWGGIILAAVGAFRCYRHLMYYN